MLPYLTEGLRLAVAESQSQDVIDWIVGQLIYKVEFVEDKVVIVGMKEINNVNEFL